MLLNLAIYNIERHSQKNRKNNDILKYVNLMNQFITFTIKYKLHLNNKIFK